MNLFELTREWKELQALMLDEELDPTDLEFAYSQIRAERDQKLNNCLKLIKHFEAMKQGVLYQVLRLEAHAKRITAAEEKVRAWVEMNLEPGEKFQSDIGAFGWRKSEAVVPAAEDTPIPDAYKVTKVTVTPDKKLMKKDLECGATIPGWSIEKRLNLQVK